MLWIGVIPYFFQFAIDFDSNVRQHQADIFDIMFCKWFMFEQHDSNEILIGIKKRKIFMKLWSENVLAFFIWFIETVRMMFLVLVKRNWSLEPKIWEQWDVMFDAEVSHEYSEMFCLENFKSSNWECKFVNNSLIK